MGKRHEGGEEETCKYVRGIAKLRLFEEIGKHDSVQTGNTREA